jgi:hypothetical protein
MVQLAAGRIGQAKASEAFLSVVENSAICGERSEPLLVRLDLVAGVKTANYAAARINVRAYVSARPRSRARSWGGCEEEVVVVRTVERRQRNKAVDNYTRLVSIGCRW